jgi:hypothetical protein
MGAWPDGDKEEEEEEEVATSDTTHQSNYQLDGAHKPELATTYTACVTGIGGRRKRGEGGERESGRSSPWRARTRRRCRRSGRRPPALTRTAPTCRPPPCRRRLPPHRRRPELLRIRPRSSCGVARLASFLGGVLRPAGRGLWLARGPRREEVCG